MLIRSERPADAGHAVFVTGQEGWIRDRRRECWGRLDYRFNPHQKNISSIEAEGGVAGAYGGWGGGGGAYGGEGEGRQGHMVGGIMLGAAQEGGAGVE